MHDPAIRDTLATLARLWEEHAEAYDTMNAFHVSPWVFSPFCTVMQKEIVGEFDRLDRTLERLLRAGPFPPEVRDAIDVTLASAPHPDGVHQICACLEESRDPRGRAERKPSYRTILRSYFRGGQS